MFINVVAGCSNHTPSMQQSKSEQPWSTESIEERTPKERKQDGRSGERNGIHGERERLIDISTLKKITFTDHNSCEKQVK